MKKVNLFAKFTALAILSAGVLFTSCKKEGCTDPEAINYKEDAKEDDGSCLYDVTKESGTIVLTYEQDGLASFDGYDESSKTYTMYSSKEYVLEGLVFVNEGQTIEIEPGTVIRGREVSGTGTALVVASGAKIYARGTAGEPIIFTAEADDLNDPDDLGPDDNQLWGGVIILGKGIVSNSGATTARIEGIESTEARAQFGGNNNADNSGEFYYVSIRHSGQELAPGDEIQALSLGGVGNGTTIHHVDVYACSDDGVEIFGGAVNLDHISVSFVEDDCFDLDQGWKGTCSNLFAIKRSDNGNTGGEWDGAIPDGDNIFTNAKVEYATFIGSGQNSTNADNNLAIIMRDGGVIALENSIIYDFPGKGIEVEDNDEQGVDSYSKMKDQGLGGIVNNIWWVGGKTELDATDDGIIQVTDDGSGPSGADPDGTWLAQHLADNGNAIQNPGISVSRTNNGGLNPVGNISGKGAFPDGSNWLTGWTSLSELGYLAN